MFNIGWKNGAASFIERQLEKNLLWLPCRHHILELVLESVYHTVMGPTTGPDITVFKQFQGHWDTIEKDKYEVPSKSDFPQFLRNRVSQIASFAENSILVSITVIKVIVGIYSIILIIFTAWAAKR